MEEEELLPVKLMGWATPEQLGFYEYLKRRYERGDGGKRLAMEDATIVTAQLADLKASWVEDKARRQTLDDLCGRLLLDPEQAVPIDNGQAEGEAG